MAISAYLPMVADRYITCVRTVRVRGLDLTDAPHRMEVRLRPDTPGEAEILLEGVTDPGDEGIRLVGTEMVDGVIESVLELVIAEATMQGLPYGGELGDDTELAYDWLVGLGGFRRRLAYGEFVVLAGVTDATNAPSNRPVGIRSTSKRSAWAVARLTYTEETVKITIDGADALFPLVAAAQAAAGEAAEAAAQYAQTTGGHLNLFDKDAVQDGYEVQFFGAVVAQANSVASAPMYVGDLTQIVISGLSPNIDIGASDEPGRVYAFYSALPADASTFVSDGQLGMGATSVIDVPAGATQFRFSPKQRDPGSVPYDLVQVQAGTVPTAFKPYEEAVVAIAGKPVGRGAPSGGEGGSIGVLALFGDSITQTEDVDSGQYVYGSNYRPNWPDYAIPLLGPGNAYNFARAEASFATRPSTLTMQSFAGQISAAFGVSGLVPDVLVVALGINDLRFIGASALGNYNTAIGKAVADLDLAIPVEAMRKGFYRLQQQWPDAVKFVSLPLQAIDSAQLQYDNIRSWADTIAKMAGRYGFTVIDAFAESGIVREFEVSGGTGRDLVDGLHTGLPGNDANPSGRRKQGRLIAADVKARLGL